VRRALGRDAASLRSLQVGEQARTARFTALRAFTLRAFTVRAFAVRAKRRTLRAKARAKEFSRPPG